MKFCYQLAAALLLAGAAGCGTAQVRGIESKIEPTEATVEYPVATVEATNVSYWLFGLLPLYSGNPHRPNTGDYHIFQDLATPENNEEMAARGVVRYRADRLDDVRTTVDWSGWYSLGTVWRKVVRTDAVVMRVHHPE
ncbi:hypothetical protein [Victivallis sp. Marseille-Q1083]|uniref:hypothetical protein n=1 Tax=Victivallis sp. Marseille-Q1083 TaxID=2717288 RepID=UPI00158E579C|nr:hypothetical protein [Victivallis sp. Marseille-Q1083]